MTRSADTHCVTSAENGNIWAARPACIDSGSGGDGGGGAWRQAGTRHVRGAAGPTSRPLCTHSVCHRARSSTAGSLELCRTRLGWFVACCSRTSCQTRLAGYDEME